MGLSLGSRNADADADPSKRAPQAHNTSGAPVLVQAQTETPSQSQSHNQSQNYIQTHFQTRSEEQGRRARGASIDQHLQIGAGPGSETHGVNDAQGETWAAGNIGEGNFNLHYPGQDAPVMVAQAGAGADISGGPRGLGGVAPPSAPGYRPGCEPGVENNKLQDAVEQDQDQDQHQQQNVGGGADGGGRELGPAESTSFTTAAVAASLSMPPAYQHQHQHQHQHQYQKQQPLSSVDWVTATPPRQPPHQASMAEPAPAHNARPSQPQLGPGRAPAPAPVAHRHITARAPVPAHEDSGIAMLSTSQVEARPETQRHPSFKGLPPIRRNSSFGLSSFDVAPAEGSDAPNPKHDHILATQNGAANDDTIVVNHQDGGLSSGGNATNRTPGADDNGTLIGQDDSSRTGPMSQQQQQQQQYAHHYQAQAQAQGQQLQVNTAGHQQGQPIVRSMLSPERMGQQNQTDRAPPQQYQQQQPQPQQQQQQQQQQSSPLQIQTSPQPPSGWQLNESHLSEPLHAARKRAGTGGSFQQPVYGYDKETGPPVPMSPTSPIQGPGQSPGMPGMPGMQPPRGRVSDVPPSSARRYPGLFRPADQQYAVGGPGGQPGQPLQGFGTHSPAQAQSGFDYNSAPSNSERGRRRTSDFFKGIGGRLSRGSSRERRGSQSSQTIEPPESQPERHASPASFQTGDATEPKKKRTSFMPSLRSRTSIDASAGDRPSSPSSYRTQDTQQAGGDAVSISQSEGKRSFFGSAAGRVSAAQHRFTSSGLTRSSTSNLHDDPNTNGHGGEGQDGGIAPLKKRFTGLTDRAAGLASRFNRQSQEGQKHPDLASQGSPPNVGVSHHPHGSLDSQIPPAPPPKDDERRFSGSFSMAPPPPANTDAPEQRSRRGSFSNMVTGFMSGRPSSRSGQGEGQVQPPVQPPLSPQYPGASAHPSPSSPVRGEIPRPPPEEIRRSADGTQRASWRLSGQSMQPSRPSPLAQESSAEPTSPKSASSSGPRDVQNTRVSMGSASRLNGPTSPEARLNGQRKSQLSTVETHSEAETPSSIHSSVQQQDESATPRQSVVSPDSFTIDEERGQQQKQEAVLPVNDSKAEPLKEATADDVSSDHGIDDSPRPAVKRQPTPHASALLAFKSGENDEAQAPTPARSSPSKNSIHTHSSLSQKSLPAVTPVENKSTTSLPRQEQQQSVPPAQWNVSREGSLASQSQQQPQPHHQQQAQPYNAPHGSPPPPQQGSPLSIGGFRQTQPSPFRSQHAHQPPQQSPPQPTQQWPQQPPPQAQQGPRPLGSQPFVPGAPPPGQAGRGNVPPGQPGSPPGQQGYNQQFQQPYGQKPVVPQPQPQPQPQQQQFQHFQPQPQPVQPEGQNSRLKGWKNRVSHQMAHITSQNNQQDHGAESKPAKSSWKNRLSHQLVKVAPSSNPEDKGNGDKPSTGGKLLGAFKKPLKAGESPPSQSSPQPGWPQQQTQWRPSPPPPQQQQGRPFPQGPQNVGQQQQQLPQQYPPNAAYLQQPQQGQGHPGAPNMQPGPRPPPGQYPQQALHAQGPQYPQQPQQRPPPGQWQGPQPGQQPQGPPQGPPQQWSQAQQMAMQQHYQQLQRPEPQYDQVPIPQSYSSVHGEGRVAPSNYNPGRQPPPPHQQQFAGPHQLQMQHPPQGYHPQGQLSPPPGPPGGLLINQQRSPDDSPGEVGGFNLPIQGNVTPGEGPTGEPLLLQRPQFIREQSVMSGRSVESGVMGGTGQRVLPGGQQTQQGQLQSKDSMTSLDGQIDSPEKSAPVNRGSALANQVSRSASVSPEMGVAVKDDTMSKDVIQEEPKPKQEEEENLYEATPQLKAAQTSGSRDTSDVSGETGAVATDTKATEESETVKSKTGDKPDEPSGSFAMELEDTADARMRTMRLDSQEEKIFYDPEGDVPKMSATSYPGQEWNPYGEPDFGDWRDEDAAVAAK